MLLHWATTFTLLISKVCPSVCTCMYTLETDFDVSYSFTSLSVTVTLSRCMAPRPRYMVPQCLNHQLQLHCVVAWLYAYATWSLSALTISYSYTVLSHDSTTTLHGAQSVGSSWVWQQHNTTPYRGHTLLLPVEACAWNNRAFQIMVYQTIGITINIFRFGYGFSFLNLIIEKSKNVHNYSESKYS